MLVDSEKLQLVLDLYHQGQMLRAYQAAEAIGPLRQWHGAAARIVAGRLAMNLGAPHLGRVLHSLAYRESRDDPQAAYYYARALAERRGPLPAWDFLQSRGPLDDAPDFVRADWLAYHAQLLGSLRDFETAEHWLVAAEKLAPDRPWICIERADLLERQDRYEDALAAARRSLDLHPWYRPGVQSAVHLLQLLDRDREALDLLRQADVHIENGPVAMQRAMLETELGLYEDARRSWERALALSPIVEKEFNQWMQGRMSDAAYYCGDYEKAADLAEKAKNPFHEAAAKKLRETAGKGRRVILPVGFVRQHHMTCAPATLSAISRFWSMPADHLDVAEAICYDGTPAHSERSWAEKNGYVAREFTVTWESTVALIDRGVPFTFTTVEATSAHLQAVIGYDSLRGTLLIRDPFMRQFGEFIADLAFKRYQSSGPRGMVLVPADRALLLDGIELADGVFYDQMYALQKALTIHDRQAAQTAYDAMEQADAGHRLTLWARRSLAAYDADSIEALATIDKLLALYPDDGNLQLSKLSYLRVLARRDERLTMLEAICDLKKSDPIFRQQLAYELKDDARLHPLALRLIRRAMRYRRTDSAILRALADLLWDRHGRAKATEIYRLAACINDKDEGLVRSYFIASRHMKQTDAAMRMLNERFSRFGRQSSQPARSLFWAYEVLNQDGEGFKSLQTALSMRPDDGDLKLFAASAHARHGRYSSAADLLSAAKGRCAPSAWLRTAADVATLKGDSTEAVALWTQIAEDDPLAADAHSVLARLLAETRSPAAALEHLEKTANRFPHNYRLTQLWIEWLRDVGPAEAEPVIRRLIEIHPADGWARRELAWALSHTGQLDEAMAEAEISLGLEPANPSAPFYKGLILARLGRLDDAAEAYRAAITLSVDADFAISNLVLASNTPAQKKAALAFVRQELVRQTIFGDALLAYRSHARGVLDAEELLASLRDALLARPDLWHAWSAVTMQLLDMGRADEALSIATQCTDRFPLLPKAWLDLASVYGISGDVEAQIAALQTTLELSPGWGHAVRALAEVYDRRGDFKDSRDLLEQATRRSPLDAYTHGALADAFWKLGQRDQAIERIQHSVKLEPGYRWAWDTLVRWSTELKKPALAIETARDLTVRRGGEARSWLVLARTLSGNETLEERLAALEKAVELHPHGFEAYDLRASLLARAGRFDEALAACKPAGWGEHLPTRLRARSAWVQAERGNIKDAIEQMQQVVQEDPNFYWAWTCLADWYRATRADTDYLKTAQALVRVYPLDSVSLGYLGEALLRTGDRPAAKAALRKSIEQAPDYEFGANLLFDMAMKDQEFDLAATALAPLEIHNSSDATSTRAACLAARRECPDAAAECLARLCAAETPRSDLIGQLTETMDSAGMSDRAESVLRNALAHENARVGFSSRLIELLARKKRWAEAGEIVLGVLSRKEIGPEAASTFLLQLGAAEQAPELRNFLAAAGKSIKANITLWGWTSYALQSVRDYRAVVRWMADWKTRPDAEAWMLVNLAEAYRALGRDADARPVHEHAMTLKAANEPHGIHTLWLAADAALAGKLARAEELLSTPEALVNRPPYHFLGTMVQAAVAGRKGASLTDIRKLVIRAEVAHKAFAKDVELRRFHRKCLRKFMLKGRGLPLRWWALRRWATGN